MEIHVSWAENVTIWINRQWQLSRNRVWQVATRWSNMDQQKATVLITKGIHNMTEYEWNVCAKLFQSHRRLLLDMRCKKPVPEDYSQHRLNEWIQWEKNRIFDQQLWPLTSMWNYRSIYLMLKWKLPAADSLILTASQTTYREILIIGCNGIVRYTW